MPSLKLFQGALLKRSTEKMHFERGIVCSRVSGRGGDYGLSNFYSQTVVKELKPTRHVGRLGTQKSRFIGLDFDSYSTYFVNF